MLNGSRAPLSREGISDAVYKLVALTVDLARGRTAPGEVWAALKPSELVVVLRWHSVVKWEVGLVVSHERGASRRAHARSTRVSGQLLLKKWAGTPLEGVSGVNGGRHFTPVAVVRELYGN